MLEQINSKIYKNEKKVLVVIIKGKKIVISKGHVLHLFCLYQLLGNGLSVFVTQLRIENYFRSLKIAWALVKIKSHTNT
jgi:hypothetical protein